MRRAFTLIEILVVVVILGLLAGLVIPQFRDFTGETRRTAFITNAKILVAAAKRYELDYGEYPHAGHGELPDGFGDYILSNQWESPTPIGGEWEARVNTGGVTAAIGVHYGGNDPEYDPAQLLVIDEIADDGELTTGAFRHFGDRHYFFVVAP
jgi:prepilin-type N-terminal cleavage/methylation domain-containing protein